MNFSSLRNFTLFPNKEETAANVASATSSSPIFVALLVLIVLGVIYVAVSNPQRFFEVFSKVVVTVSMVIFKVVTVIGTVIVKIIMGIWDWIFRKKQ